jgi:trans-2,3-dihydro-3-hydroxyanthranilate isomerase
MCSPKIECIVGQGHEIERPSLLFLEAEERNDGNIDIMVGGKVFEIASGEWPV